MFLQLVKNVFKNVQKQNIQQLSSLASATTSQQFNQLQEEALKENCILVDENDVAIGVSSKKDCHRVDNEGKVKLHRAFSVFLFNSNGDMLVQRRSIHKITFPDTYTNACCSHPLFDNENEQIELNEFGIRNAAQRRLNYELGISYNDVQASDFHYLTRIHYHNNGNGIWGEHEIDYILFLQKDIKLNPNENEISEVRYIKKSEFNQDILKLDAPLTPWFKLIMKNRLKLWWDNLHQLNKFEDFKNIQRF